MDKRKKYILVIDTETANSFSDVEGKLDLTNSLVYDIGYQVIDKKGNIYEKNSFVIYDIFFGYADLMRSAYYAEKIPRYIEDIRKGKRKVVTFKTAQKIITEAIKKYDCVVSAHNAHFDLRALNVTLRYLTKSKQRYFFPYRTEIWDSLKMARDIFCKQQGYINFCQENGYMTKHKTPQPRATAEILYRYISGNYDFVESHTGFEDVEIETEIVVFCLRAHKKMRKRLFEKPLPRQKIF